MNRIKATFLVFALLVVSAVSAQSYELKKDIFYREGQKGLDAYQKERCKLDVYYPKGEKGFATVIWIHGGALLGGSKHLPKELMEQGVAVVPINYRLAPKVEAPAFIDDAAAAVAWVFEHIEEYGGDKSKIFVTGHSAGGYLVSMVGLDKSYLARYNVDADDVAAYLPLSGQCLTHFTIREQMHLEKGQLIADKYAPMYHLRNDIPPMVLVTGDRTMELAGRWEENALFLAGMKMVGMEKIVLHELDGFDHGSMAAPGCLLVLKYMHKVLKGEF